MAKDKSPDKDQENKNDADQSNIDEENLSPWQKANLNYMQQQGETPHWQEKKSTDADEEDAEAVENEIDEEESKKVEAKAKFKVLESVKGKKRISYVEKLPNLKQQTNRVLRRRILILLAAFGIPLIILSYFVSPWSKLQTLTVSGNSEVSSEAIISSSTFTIGDNIFEEYFNREEHSADIFEKNPRVKAVSVSLANPVSLNLQVSEYQEAAVLLRDDQYYPILENGVVLEEATSEDVSAFPILQDFTDQEIITETISAYGELAADIQSLIQVIQYTPSANNLQLLTLTMNDGNQVIVPYETMVSQMQYYPQVASQMTENGVIDMEVGIFSYPYGTDQTLASTTESSSES